MNALGYARVALGLALVAGCVAVAAFYTGEPGTIWACAAVGCVFFAAVGWFIVEAHRAEQEWLYLERGAMRRLHAAPRLEMFEGGEQDA